MPGRAQYYCCGQQHINVPHGRNALLLLRKPLSFKTALRLLVPTGLPRKINPPRVRSTRAQTASPEAVARIVSEETLDSLVRAEMQRQRERLKGKRGAWSPVKTRNPLERPLEKEMLSTGFRKIFDETLRLLREFSKTHAPPSSPHARPKYDRLMVVALLILKEMSPQPISFEGIGGAQSRRGST